MVNVRCICFFMENSSGRRQLAVGNNFLENSSGRRQLAIGNWYWMKVSTRVMQIQKIPMAWVKRRCLPWKSIAGKRLFEFAPDRIWNLGTRAHAFQEFDQRISSLKAFGACQLYDAGNLPEDPECVLDLNAGFREDLEHVRAAIVLSIKIGQKTDACRRSKL